MSRGWFAETETCKCGHAKAGHGADGRCEPYADAIPLGPVKPGRADPDRPGVFYVPVQNVKQPEGTCWCKSFDGEPWSWSVWQSFGADSWIEDPEKPGWKRTDPEAQPQHYTVQKQGHDKTYGPYKTEAAARRRCDELNREMAQGPLDPAFKERRARLVRLAPGGVYYLHEGAPGTEWPIKPDRYLAFGYSDGWHGESWVALHPTLDTVREALEDPEGNEIGRVVDLDTGEDVSFEREISVRLGVSS